MAAMIRWYPILFRDRTRVKEALLWFLAEYEAGMQSVDISGSLMRANQSQSGLMSYYDSLHSELAAILELVDQDLRIVRAGVLRDFADNPPTKTKLNATDLKILIDAEPPVVAAGYVVEEVKMVYKMFGAVLKGLDQRGYRLGDISKLRVAGMQEVEV